MTLAIGDTLMEMMLEMVLGEVDMEVDNDVGRNGCKLVKIYVEFGDNNFFGLFTTVFGHIKAQNLHVVAAILTYIMSISSNVCLSNPYHSP